MNTINISNRDLYTNKLILLYTVFIPGKAPASISVILLFANERYLTLVTPNVPFFSCIIWLSSMNKPARFGRLTIPLGTLVNLFVFKFNSAKGEFNPWLKT